MSNPILEPTAQRTRRTGNGLGKDFAFRIGMAALTLVGAVGVDTVRSFITGGSIPTAEAACENIQTGGTITLKVRMKYETDPRNYGRQDRMPDGSRFSLVYEPQVVKVSEINGRLVIGEINDKKVDEENVSVLAQPGRYFTHTQSPNSEQQVHELTVPANATRKDNCGNDLPAAQVWVFPHVGQKADGTELLSNDPRPDTYFDTAVVKTGRNQDGIVNGFVLKQPEKLAPTVTPTPTSTPTAIPTATRRPVVFPTYVPDTGEGPPIPR